MYEVHIAYPYLVYLLPMIQGNLNDFKGSKWKILKITNASFLHHKIIEYILYLKHRLVMRLVSKSV